MEQYDLPFYQKSGFKWYVNLLFLFCTIFMVGGSIFFFLVLMKDDFGMGLLFGLFFLVLGLYFAYLFTVGGALGRFYIEMTSEYIKVSLPFKYKTAYWNEIYQAEVYNFNNSTAIAILLVKDINKKRKRSINNNLNSLYGIPSSSFQIPMSFFKETDPQRLLLTIGEQINKVSIKEEAYLENLNESLDDSHNSLIKALITSTLICAIITVIYGVSIYKLKENYVPIPIFGCFIIISAFNKYYVEESFNLFVRLLVGLICLIQVPAAVIGVINKSIGFSFTLRSISIVTTEYFKNLVHNPSKQIAVIIVSIVCFLIGIFKGRTGREKKNLNITQ